jgi:hypothetical protein
MRIIQYWKGSELPAIAITRYDPNGSLYNFSSGWTFTARVGTPGLPAVATGTVTGAATSPNMLVDFAIAQFDSVAQGTYHLEVTPRFTGTSKDLTPNVLLFQVLEGVAA